MTHQQACATALLNVLRTLDTDAPNAPTTAQAKKATNYRLIIDNAAYDRLKETAGEPPLFQDYEGN